MYQLEICFILVNYRLILYVNSLITFAILLK